MAAEDSGLRGKQGQVYKKWGGVCLMTQNYRDSVNHLNFPAGTLRPGQLPLLGLLAWAHLNS